jgi:hypothetical protein
MQCLAPSEKNIDHPPPLRPASVYTPPPPPPPLVRGEDTLAGWRGGRGGSIVRKTPDTALYSIYVSTLWRRLFAKCLDLKVCNYWNRFVLNINIEYLKKKKSIMTHYEEHSSVRTGSKRTAVAAKL